MPDRLMGISVGELDGTAPWEASRIQREGAQVADWMEDQRSQLLAFTQRNLMKALAVHYDPEDVLQDAYCRTWKNPGSTRQLKEPKAFERWMRRVILNRVLDLRRMVSVRERVWPAGGSGEGEGKQEGVFLEQIPGTAVGAVSCGRTARQGGGDAAVREICVLPFEEQICVLMRDILDMDWSSVAATLQRSKNGAKSLRHRARGRIL